jgi:hypothetical protein
MEDISEQLLLLQSLSNLRGISIGTIKAVNSNGTVKVEVTNTFYRSGSSPIDVNKGPTIYEDVPLISIWPLRVKPKVGVQAVLFFSMFSLNADATDSEDHSLGMTSNNCVALAVATAKDSEMLPATDIYIEGTSGVDIVLGDKNKAAFVALASKTNTVLNNINDKLSEVIVQLNLLVSSSPASSVLPLLELADVSTDNVKAS